MLKNKRDSNSNMIVGATNGRPQTKNSRDVNINKERKERKRMDYLKVYEDWCNNEVFDENTRKELINLKGNDEEIKDRFYKELEFGTAGLRGVIGAGTNRMNKYTVGKATQGLANFIVKNNVQDKGVVIAYDSRIMSDEFSEQTALILNANGIKTYLFESLRPTPVLSFSVRELKCTAGIVITASHNPPEYNGYKVYWQDGAQISNPIDKGIMEEINKIKDYSEIKTMNKEEATTKGLFNIVGKQVDDRYIEELKKLVINKEIIDEESDELKIVYTPLHGTGAVMAKRILSELGFKNIFVVPEQEKPDGRFPTVTYPNPEDPKAFELALKLAAEKDADIILANDPDADRIGMFVKKPKTGEYILFNGNMTGLLIADYILSSRKEKGTLPANAAIIKTIVSSNMTEEIAKYYNVKLFEVLTGFKNIAEKIRQFEVDHSYDCLYGFEESYGCLIGTHARDKDGIVAAMMLCEIAAVCKKNGITIYDRMIEMYEKYGYYKEGQVAVTLKGADGAVKIKEMMEKMRNNPPKQIGEYTVLAVRDYNFGKINNLVENKVVEADLPKSNVLYYELDKDAWCCIRPSGTEPKVKMYIGIKGNNLEDAETKLEELKKAMAEIAE